MKKKSIPHKKQKHKELSRSNTGVIAALLILLILLPSFISSREFTDPFILPKIFTFYFISGSVLILLIFKFIRTRYLQKISFNNIDYAVLVFCVYQIIRLFFTQEVGIENDSFITLIISILLYFGLKPLFRVTHEEQGITTWIAFSFTLIYLGQVMYGLFQYLEILPRLQTEFTIGGAFGNPGPYSNFLIPMLPFVLYIAVHPLENKLRIINYTAWLALLISVMVIPLTKARSAWIAALFGTAIFVFFYYDLGVKLKSWFKFLWQKILLISLLLLFLSASAVYLFKYKEASASGRIFIWKISGQMIIDKPLFGHGFDQYLAAHNVYQAAYFAEKKHTPSEIDLADSVSYAFNDFIQMAVESGMIGLLLFLLVVYFLFRKRVASANEDPQRNRLLLLTRTATIMILICALFSYPLRTLPNNVLLFIFFSIISAITEKIKTQISTSPTQRRIIGFIGVILLVIFMGNQTKKYKAAKLWLQAFNKVRTKEYTEALSVYNGIYPTLEYNPYFLFNYGAELSVMGKYERSMQILEQAKPRLQDADLHIYLGNSYEGLGQHMKAIESFRMASLVMPVKFYPKYRVAKLYIKTQEYQLAEELAKEILNMKVKVPSATITNIQMEMQQFLDEFN